MCGGLTCKYIHIFFWGGGGGLGVGVGWGGGCTRGGGIQHQEYIMTFNETTNILYAMLYKFPSKN